MPLDRHSVTIASRVMLPAYVVFFAVLGLNYLLTPLSRLRESPGLAYADALLSLRLWGVVFLAAAAVMAAALVAGHRDWFRAALVFCGLSMLVFALALIAAFVNGQASPAAWTWPGLVIAACVASYRSLSAREA